MVLFNKNEENVDVGLAKFSELLNGNIKAIDILSEKEIMLSSPISIEAKSALILEFQ